MFFTQLLRFASEFMLQDLLKLVLQQLKQDYGLSLILYDLYFCVLVFWVHYLYREKNSNFKFDINADLGEDQRF